MDKPNVTNGNLIKKNKLPFKPFKFIYNIVSRLHNSLNILVITLQHSPLA